MRQQTLNSGIFGRPISPAVSRQMVVGGILVIALIAFELFNFDTTKYALTNLLGPISFAGVGWAAILAIAFCGIDLAGLVRLLTPERGADEPKEVWYLMGAWLLGATMNAVMTWWAVSLTLLNHEFGNEVLSREALLKSVPIFVAVLVWLTRILFIGSISVAGEQLIWGNNYGGGGTPSGRKSSRKPTKKKSSSTRKPRTRTSPAPKKLGGKPSYLSGQRNHPAVIPGTYDLDEETVDMIDGEMVETYTPKPRPKVNNRPRTVNRPGRPNPAAKTRVNRRPPMPMRGGTLNARARNPRS